jgi:hypothetical protein
VIPARPGWGVLFVALAAALVSCSKTPPPETPEALAAVARARGPAVRFRFDAIDGRPVSTAAFANRVSVIGFLTTYDVPSQVVARFLSTLERRHTPRVNVAALILEAPENLPLVEAFAASLRLGYPIALADAETIAGEGPFAGLHHVPSVVVLDRSGREAWRHVGFVGEAALEAAVRAVEATSPPPSEDPATAGDEHDHG